MRKYEIILAHGPVIETEYLGDDTVRYLTDDGKKFDIRFEKTADGRFFREVTVNDGTHFSDTEEYDIFNEGLSVEDYAQWTADNFEEILEGIEHDAKG